MARTINGQTYQAHSTYQTKADAERAAHTLRNRGWSIRIIKEASHYRRTLYVLYGRRGR